MADPTIADIKTLAEEAIAARELANDCLPIEYHDYSNKAMAAHEKYWEALGKLQPDDFLAKLALSLPSDVAGLVSELRGLAEKAVPRFSHPSWDDEGQCYHVYGDDLTITVRCSRGQQQMSRIAEYIAAANPANITKLLDYVTALSVEQARLTKALEDIALLDEAGGHELDESHAFEAVAIATKTLGKHPSQIFSERALTRELGEG